jgi:hypothetical protein
MPNKIGGVGVGILLYIAQIPNMVLSLTEVDVGAFSSPGITLRWYLQIGHEQLLSNVVRMNLLSLNTYD